MNVANPIPVNIAVEDALSDAVLRRILELSGRNYAIGVTFSGGGNTYLRNRINGFNDAARGRPILVMTDLDLVGCAPILLRTWLNNTPHPNLILRVAVREVESWLLADRRGIATFFGVAHELVPVSVEAITHPKEALIDLARRSRWKDVRNDIVPPMGSRRNQGPNYNGRLTEFVNRNWDINRASQSSDSLQRTVTRIAEFNPVWPR